MKERRLSLPLRRAVRSLFVTKDRPPKTIEKYLGSLDTVFVDTGRSVTEFDLKNGRARRVKIDEEELKCRRMINPFALPV